MRNRLRELIDKSFQGEITGLDPDGHPVSFEHHERCRTMTELATKFHSPKNAKGHLSVAQVSRMINNPHRKLRPDQAEVFFWQVEPTSGLDKEEFLDVLAADFRQRNESAEAEETRFRMTALERELADVKDQLRSVTAKFEQSQELLRREN